MVDEIEPEVQGELMRHEKQLGDKSKGVKKDALKDFLKKLDRTLNRELDWLEFQLRKRSDKKQPM